VAQRGLDLRPRDRAGGQRRLIDQRLAVAAGRQLAEALGDRQRAPDGAVVGCVGQDVDRGGELAAPPGEARELGVVARLGLIAAHVGGAARLGGAGAWALDALLLRTAADPRHTIGRIYASELAAALADAAFVARTPGLAVLQQDFLAIWTANVVVSDPGDLPLPLARSRALLASRGVATFTGAYPADLPSPVDIAATPFPMPFPPGTEITCMQGNNSMSADASHGPNELRYALDLNAPLFTTIAASASGTAYIYDHARPGSFDNDGFGNLLLIDLHNGYALLHAHLSSFAVANGQAVTAGQVVGTSGITGAAGAEPHVHFQVVRLFRTPDPAHEEYHSDTPIAADGPFGSPEPFSLLTLDITAGDTVRAPLASTAFTCGESGWLPGAAHTYRAR
jgi:murein DD-endopeptidase MepM/ murein hydrolase activator NlpD